MKRNSVIQQGPQICNGIRLILKMRTIWFFKIKNWNLGVESCSPSHRDTQKAYGGDHGIHEWKELWPGGWRGNRVDSVQQGTLKACKKQEVCHCFPFLWQPLIHLCRMEKSSPLIWKMCESIHGLGGNGQIALCLLFCFWLIVFSKLIDKAECSLVGLATLLPAVCFVFQVTSMFAEQSGFGSLPWTEH